MRVRTESQGQATVEFAIVIAIFILLVFGTIGVARAIFEKHTLARAAEVITQELAQTDPGNHPFNIDPVTGLPVGGVPPWQMTSADVQTAIVDAAMQADLGLSTAWPASGTDIASLPGADDSKSFDPSTNLCDNPIPASGPGSTAPSCQAAPNQDGSVVVIGYPDLAGPDTIKVIVSEPYQSYLEYPLQFLNGNASETVAATTLTAQQN